MAKLITLDNLDQAVRRLLQLINAKLGVREKAEVSSLQIDDIQNENVEGSVDIAYNANDHKVFFVADDDGNLNIESPVTEDINAKSVVLSLPSNTDDTYHVAVLEDSSQVLNASKTITGLISTIDNYGRESIYALPGASAENRLASTLIPMDESTATMVGGGTILTTRYRSLDKRGQSVTLSNSTECLIYSNAYTVLSFITSGTLSELIEQDFVIVGSTDGNPCDHWVEIPVPKLEDNELKFTFTYTRQCAKHTLQPIGDRIALRWADGSPDWNTLKGYTVQIHVINGVATWNVIGSNIVSELKDMSKVVFDGFVTSQLTQIYTEGTFVYDRTEGVFKLGIKVSDNQIQVINIQPDKYHIYFNRSDNKFYLYSNNNLEEVGVIGGGVSPSPSFELFDVSSTGNGIVTITAGENNYDINLNHSHPEYLKAKILANETAYQSETKQNDVLYIVKGSTPKIYLGTIPLT